MFWPENSKSGGSVVQNILSSFRSVLIAVVSCSLLLSPVDPAYARGKSDGEELRIPAPPGIHGSLRVTMPPLPPGIPIPVPVPGPPAVVEKSRERSRPSTHHDYNWSRDDHRYYSRHKSDWRHDRGRHRDWYRPHGSVYRSIPSEAFALSIAGGMFFFHMGNYYRRSHEGYVVVQAPLGARVRGLPEWCSPLYIDGRRYYVCDDVYYESDGSDFVVIERPSRGDYSIEVGDEVRISVEHLNVRSGPGTRYKVVSQLYRGDVVEVGGIEGKWYYVNLADGLYGWVLQEYVGLYRRKNEAKG